MFLIVAALLLQPATELVTDWDKEFGVEEKQRDPEGFAQRANRRSRHR